MGKINDYVQRKVDELIENWDRKDEERKRRAAADAPPLFLTRAQPNDKHEELIINNRPDDA